MPVKVARQTRQQYPWPVECHAPRTPLSNSVPVCQAIARAQPGLHLHREHAYTFCHRKHATPRQERTYIKLHHSPRQARHVTPHGRYGIAPDAWYLPYLGKKFVAKARRLDKDYLEMAALQGVQETVWECHGRCGMWECVCRPHCAQAALCAGRLWHVYALIACTPPRLPVSYPRTPLHPRPCAERERLRSQDGITDANALAEYKGGPRVAPERRPASPLATVV